jgi:hypothetical protein
VGKSSRQQKMQPWGGLAWIAECGAEYNCHYHNRRLGRTQRKSEWFGEPSGASHREKRESCAGVLPKMVLSGRPRRAIRERRG